MRMLVLLCVGDGQRQPMFHSWEYADGVLLWRIVRQGKAVRVVLLLLYSRKRTRIRFLKASRDGE